jgi:hypothetical protein
MCIIYILFLFIIWEKQEKISKLKKTLRNNLILKAIFSTFQYKRGSGEKQEKLTGKN